MKLISIVFSFRNEEKNLKELISRVDSVFNKIENYKYELIFVNDASNDNSEKILIELQESHSLPGSPFSLMSEQFNAFARILAMLVFPTPLVPVKRYA